MKKLYDDFGDVFAYEGEQGFWKWWTQKGDYLFGVITVLDAEVVEDWDSLAGFRDLFDSEQVTILVLPNDRSKAKMLKAVQGLIKDIPIRKEVTKTANYPPKTDKIDVESLQNCLLAYDMRQAGASNLEIGAYFSISDTDAQKLLIDARKKGSAVQSIKADAEQVRKTKLTAEEFDKLLDMDDATEEELAVARTKKKNYLNLKASRMIKKARANIEAVEQGVFPVGH